MPQPYRRLFSLGVCVLLASMLAIGCAQKSPSVYTNPIVAKDWPDPGVIVIPGERRALGILGREAPTYYLVSTGGRMPIKQSRDLINWEETDAALLPERRAPWSPDGRRNWAPEIHKVGDRFVAYYTASAPVDEESQRRDPLAIGAAWADDILGPYRHLPEPLVPAGTHGTIDATYFHHRGRHYLYWKTDGNCCGVPTHIMVQGLAPDGVSFLPGSEPQRVLTSDLPWEHGLIEGPWLLERDGWIYLFYSGARHWEDYRNGVARSRSPLGPFEKLPEPFLVGDDVVRAPGHGSFLTVRRRTYFLHHGRMEGIGNARYLFLTPIRWRDGWPYVEGGTTPMGPLPTP